MAQGWQPLAWLTWINKPSIATPINQTNLNQQIKTNCGELDTRTRTLDTIKFDTTDANQLVKSITFDSTTGIFTITKQNGSASTIDTKIEKIAVNFYYDDDPTSPHYQSLVITLDDGTKQYIDMSALITQYEFETSSTVGFRVTLGKVYADVLDGSITAEKLDPNYLAQCLNAVAQASGYATQAGNSATAADTSAKDSEAWAVGTRGGSAVSGSDVTYHNNSKYYAGEAVTSATTASNALTQIQRAINAVQFTVDLTTGEILYNDDIGYSFEVNTATGVLEWEVVV